MSLTPSHCLASAGGSFISLITGHFLASSAFSCLKFSWPGGNLLLGVDRLDRAFGLAQRAVDALVRVDHEKIRTLVEAVHGTYLHAVHVFALDAAFGDHERHDLPFSMI